MGQKYTYHLLYRRAITADHYFPGHHFHHLRRRPGAFPHCLIMESPDPDPCQGRSLCLDESGPYVSSIEVIRGGCKMITSSTVPPHAALSAPWEIGKT